MYSHKGLFNYQVLIFGLRDVLWLGLKLKQLNSATLILTVHGYTFECWGWDLLVVRF